MYDTTVYIGNPNEIIAYITPDSINAIYGEVITTEVIVNLLNSTFNWTPDQNIDCNNCQSVEIVATNVSEYMVIVENNGCYDTAYLHLNITDSLDNLYIYIPNAFSPNGDGHNDVFTAYSNGVNLFNMKLFNRWGEKVFESNNINEGWNGIYKGAEQPIQVFVYSIDVVFTNTESRHYSGSVTLIR